MHPPNLNRRQTCLLFHDHPDNLRLDETILPPYVCSPQSADSTSDQRELSGETILPQLKDAPLPRTPLHNSNYLREHT